MYHLQDSSNVTQNTKLWIENIVDTSIFFFSHNVFKRLFPPVRQSRHFVVMG